jgi:hypothetical protein
MKKKLIPLVILAALAIVALKFLRPGAAAAEAGPDADPLADPNTSRNVDDDDPIVTPPKDDPALPTEPAKPTHYAGFELASLEAETADDWQAYLLKIAAKFGREPNDKETARFAKNALKEPAREELREQRQTERDAKKAEREELREEKQAARDAEKAKRDAEIAAKYAVRKEEKEANRAKRLERREDQREARAARRAERNAPVIVPFGVPITAVSLIPAGIRASGATS